MTIQAQIEAKLNQSLSPIYLDVQNESHRHSVPPGSETHFKIVVVSDSFQEKKLLARHRHVNEILTRELEQIRACSLHTYTPSEWASTPSHLASPRCLGGSKK